MPGHSPNEGQTSAMPWQDFDPVPTPFNSVSQPFAAARSRLRPWLGTPSSRCQNVQRTAADSYIGRNPWEKGTCQSISATPQEIENLLAAVQAGNDEAREELIRESQERLCHGR